MDDYVVDVNDLIKKYSIDELIESAEYHYKQFGNDDYMLTKPFTSIEEAPNHLIHFAVLLRGLNILPGMTVLDFGCGSGYTSRMINQLGCKVISLDVSPTALEYAQRAKEFHTVFGEQPEHTFIL